MQLVLDSKAITLQKKNQSFHIKTEKGSRTISPAKLTSIAITTTITLKTDAVLLAIKNQIPILFFDRIGKAKARLWSPYFESIATLRRSQIRFQESTAATQWMIDLFLLKTQAQINNLKYLSKKRMLYAISLTQATAMMNSQSRQWLKHREHLIEECQQNLMGIEGAIARAYWQSLGQAMPRPFGFPKRSRRPAADVFNAAINYLYGMMYSVVEGAVFAAGLDPQLGMLHADEYKKPTLVFDLIEAFRPWVDRLLIDACLQKQIKTSFFTKNQYGLFLNKDGKAYIIPLFNDFLRREFKYQGKTSTTKNHIYALAGKLAQRIRIVQ